MSTLAVASHSDAASFARPSSMRSGSSTTLTQASVLRKTTAAATTAALRQRGAGCRRSGGGFPGSPPTPGAATWAAILWFALFVTI